MLTVKRNFIILFLYSSLFIIAESIQGANIYVHKTVGVPISIPPYNVGDTLVVQGDSLESIPNNDWDAFKYLTDTYHLVLEVLNQSIPADAFQGCTSLQSVRIISATSIGNSAFQSCSKLEYANIPNATTIGSSAFSGSNQLRKVNIPLALTIENDAFNSCSGLDMISFPNVEHIGLNAFISCTSILSVDLPKVIGIGLAAFHSCSSLNSINLPNAISVGMYSFTGCAALESVYMPQIDTIKYGAFMNCFSLQTVYMPNATTLMTQAFSNCTALQTIHLPNAVEISDYAFYGCANLQAAIFPNVSNIGSSVFDGTNLLSLELGYLPPTINGAVSTTDPLLVIVPDTVMYIPLDNVIYPTGSEAFVKSVSTHSVFLTPSLELIPDRIPTLPGGTFQWKKEGLPISGANGTSYQPTSEGLYTLEYTYGGRSIILLSSFVTRDSYNILGIQSKYEGCLNTLTISFAPSVTERTMNIRTVGSGANFVFDPILKEYFNNDISYVVPSGDSILTIHYEIDTSVVNGSQFYFVCQFVGGYPEQTETFNLYARPEFTILKYYYPSTLYPGLLEIDVKNGSPYMQRSLNKGRSWEFVRDTITGALIPFKQSQITNLEDGDFILFRQPYSCMVYDTLTLIRTDLYPLILRKVIMPQVPGADCNVLPGEYMIKSGDDFKFIITPTESNIGFVPKVSTSRLLTPDSEGVSIVKVDGNYHVTIHKIQESINVYIDFVLSNQSFEATKVWSNDNQLFIQTVEDGKATVYNLSGSYIQKVNLSAGQLSSINLSKGFYIIQIKGKTYKIAVL